MRYGQQVGAIMESMGVSTGPVKSTGAQIQHGIVPGTNYPKEVFAKLDGYRQSEIEIKHGAKPTYGALLFHWNGSHFGGGSTDEAAKHNLLYTGVVKIPGNRAWGKIICMQLDYIAANGGKRTGAGYMNLTQLVLSSPQKAVIDRCWEFYSGGMGSGNLAKPTTENALGHYLKFDLPTPDVEEGLKDMLAEHPELASEIAMLWNLGLRFTGMEEIKATHQNQEAVRTALARVEEAGLIGDADQDYASQTPTFTVLSENTVDSNNSVAILSIVTGENAMFTKSVNEYGCVEMISEDKRTEINTVPGMAEVRVDGERVAEYYSDDTSFDKWADQVRLGIDRDGLAVNEAVAQAEQVIAG